MKVSLKRINIEDNPNNEVTTHKVFKSRKVFDANGNPIFHDDGIFSKRIFGKFGRCECGALMHPGICKRCGCRVLDKKSLPDFYTKFDDIDIPYTGINTDKFTKHKKEIKKLLNFEGFLYDGKYVEFDLNNIDISIFEIEKVKIGKEAVLSLGVDEEWYNDNTTNKIYIPHTSLRKITVQGENYFLGEMNVFLINILKLKNKLSKFTSLATADVFTELAIKKELMVNINAFYNSLYELLSKRKNSIINREVKGQGITGAARAVVTNNFELDEDTAIIGYYFIPTLFPHLYEKYVDPEDNTIDVVALNDELKDYMILINRQPTIGEKSIMAFHPVFSDKVDERYVLQINPIVQDGFAGDFDGDVYLIIALYTKEACNEAKRLLPSRNYINGANGTIRNSIFEDLEYVMKKSYDDNNFEDIHKLILEK